MERFNSLFALAVFVILCSLTSGTNGDCNMENSKTGAKWCGDAYKMAIEKNQPAVLFGPKDNLCCLSYNMGNCIQHSFEKADCSGSNKNLEAIVTEEVENVQKETNKMASSVGSFICGKDLSESKCKHLAEEFNKVEVRINQLNGASSVGLTIATVIAVACSLIFSFYS